MKTVKKLGICMDNISADLIEFSTNKIKKIASAFTSFEKEKINSEKQQNQALTYYKKLALEIEKHDSVVLFGTSDAKSQLYNFLKADHRYDHVLIEVIRSKDLNENYKYDL
ncbi:hypothetical protein [Flavobacterium sp.]|uniref:hypothetical protein n=1 Tax=Flavobacterium sp. TaxID=239 RepID=UPI0032659B45